MAAKIKKGDKVVVITGRDKGKQGEVLKVLVKEQRAVVQGINMVTRHQRPSQFDAGGLKEKEGTIHLSNLAHVDPTDGKATRVGFKTLADGKKVRVSKRSGEVIDV
jgi:large subunit ribosomal protein L24